MKKINPFSVKPAQGVRSALSLPGDWTSGQFCSHGAKDAHGPLLPQDAFYEFRLVAFAGSYISDPSNTVNVSTAGETPARLAVCPCGAGDTMGAVPAIPAL